MPIRSLEDEVKRLSRSAQTLAACGALLRMRKTAIVSAEEISVERRLEEFVSLTIPEATQSLNSEQADLVLGYIDLLLEEAIDLLRHPDRSPGWHVHEPAFLSAQGRMSRYGFRAIGALAAQFPSLDAALDGVFLDVGAGTAGLTLEAVSRRPKLHAVAIDIWEPGLALARADVAADPCADRIELRRQDVRSLDDRNAFDVAWLPAPS